MTAPVNWWNRSSLIAPLLTLKPSPTRRLFHINGYFRGFFSTYSSIDTISKDLMLMRLNSHSNEMFFLQAVHTLFVHFSRRATA